MVCQNRIKQGIGVVLAIALMGLLAWPAPSQAAVTPTAEDDDLLAEPLAERVDPALASRVNTFTTLYQVRPGDTLWSIARRYGVDWELVAAMNYLDGDVIEAGQFLTLPRYWDEVYYVRPGDVLTAVAKRFQVDLEVLMAVNEIINPDRIFVGQKLIIPAPANAVPVMASLKRTTVSRGGHTFTWPVEGRITSPYGPRGGAFHYGVDIAAPQGTPVLAAMSGIISFAGWKGSFGNLVAIDHGNGMETLYAHNAKLLVNEGEYVLKGQVIARVGSTGRTTGPHVHLELKKDGRNVDPLPYLQR